MWCRIKRQLRDWRDFAASEKGIDLIVGHHPHVAQGVEMDGASLIFYGLGNFMHPGTAEMSRFGICRDYGLMAKVHLARMQGYWRAAAIEVIPLTKTNIHPERFAPEQGVKRIYALNYLGAQLGDGKAAQGVRFTPRKDGTGLYCTEGAELLDGNSGRSARASGRRRPFPASLPASSRRPARTSRSMARQRRSASPQAFSVSARIEMFSS